MLLIEVNNKGTQSNFKLLEETEVWAKNNIGEGVQYVIVLNPNLNEPMRITKRSVIEGEGEE